MGGVGKRRSVTIRLVAVMVMVDLVVGLREAVRKIYSSVASFVIA